MKAAIMAPSPASTIHGFMLNLADYQREAEQRVEPAIWAWLEGASGNGMARQREQASFAEYAIVPRVLASVAHGSTKLHLLGQELAHPVLLGPVGYHRLLHPQGELATASGALDTVLCLSTMSSVAVEQVAAHAQGPLWFQLYWQPSREDTLALVRRAEDAGAQALVLTLDTLAQPASHSALRAGFALPADVSAVHVQGMAPAAPLAGHWYHPALAGLAAAAPVLEDLHWLRQQTNLPLLAKGVCHPQDAQAVLQAGFAGIVLSTHGGRALDEAPAPLRLLPAMRAALGSEAVILLDGSIRSGGDVFKALALGADAVLVGRPQLHALAVAGSLGVAHMLKLLREELELTMALAGCASLADITPASLIPV
jgi:4-hydroxymandelate oxidase